MKIKPVNISDTEIIITYQSPYSKGTMIMDLNFFNKYHNKIMKSLKDCDILSMIERRKQ